MTAKLSNIIGQKHNKLLIIGPSESVKGHSMCLCQCDCGTIKSISAHNVTSGKTKSCGCAVLGRIKPQPGQRFGSFIVINTDGTSKNGYNKTLCQCDCGTIRSVQNRSLFNGTSKSCGCCLYNYTELIGKKFGNLTVVGTTKARKGSKAWEIECVCDCGNTRYYAMGRINRGGVTKCRECSDSNSARWTGFGEISGSYWDRTLKAAKSRNMEFAITIEYGWELFLLQNRTCTLSGEILSFARSMKKPYSLKQTASLDRIDSDLGYIHGNVQWVHKELNVMKMDASQENFIEWCRKIAHYQSALSQVC